MKRTVSLAVVLWFASGSLLLAGGPPQGRNVLDWSELPPLPNSDGLAGAFAGVANGALIVAGGTNFQGQRLWEDAQKTWYDDVYVLTNPKGRWKTGFKLPRPLAYGVSVTTDDGVICIGGGDAERHYAEVFQLRWRGGKLEVLELPPLPEAMAFGCGAMLGRTIYVAGGKDWPKPRSAGSTIRAPATMHTFWALDLEKKRSWKKLEPWPGPSRMLAVAAVQDGAFYLVGGQCLDPSQPGDDKRVFLKDGYRYDPKARQWARIADLPRCMAAAPSPAVSLGQSHFAVIGGDDGTHAFRVETLKDRHPGFPAEILCYHAITDTWARMGFFPKDPAAGRSPPVTTATTWWHGRVVVPAGEIRPRVRTAKVLWAEPVRIRAPLGRVNYGVIAVYLAAVFLMGAYFARKGKTTGDLFLGGRRIPWWAAGLSIFGTMLSSITYIAIPALVYRTDWVYFVGNLMIVAIAPVVVFLYLPFYRRLEVTSIYEYLEKRFNLLARMLGSLAFILFQLGRMGVVLYLPALALATVVDMNIYLCILAMGLFTTFYTVAGGIEAVIWTDVVQVIILLGAALLSLVVALGQIDGGLAAAISMGMAEGKFHAVNWTWDFTVTALWVVVIGRFLEQFVPFTADQAVVQRYLTTRDERTAARGIWTNAVMTIPATFLFFSIGTALWAFYKTHPELLNPNGRNDDIFPWFMVQQLPLGLAGLVVAGLFSAAMSTLSSSVNSVAAALTTDFYLRLRPTATDRQSLALARGLSLLLGLAGTASALYMAYLNSPSMWDQYTKILGLFGGGMAGLFAAGIFTRRTSGTGIVLGFLASAVILYWVSTYTPAHFFLYAGIGMLSCLAVGYLASLVLPGRRQNLQGLTIFTLPPRKPAEADKGPF